jgi:hypothetical protein
MANGVSVHLNVSVESGEVMARLDFENRSNNDIFIEKYNACVEGQIENNVFEIRTNDQMLNYIGMLVKRRRPVLEDYLVIRAGRIFETEVDLTRAYAFSRGLREYSVVYSAVISYPDRDGIWTLTSKPVPFRLAGITHFVRR